VKLSGPIPFFILFDGGKPKPWQFATALMAGVITVIFGDI
jgi:hypothetical protein